MQRVDHDPILSIVTFENMAQRLIDWTMGSELRYEGDVSGAKWRTSRKHATPAPSQMKTVRASQ
uniref:Uncharacterized protein n=1 Tax=Peronospora matthiolae TaxID=2874970 RepID=A0AAV1TI32_9STRA